MQFKLVKKSSGKIRCLRHEKSKIEFKPEDIGLSDSLTEANLTILENAFRQFFETDKKPKFYDLLNDINYDKKCLINDERYYKLFQPYTINRILSFSKDCIFHVAEMNESFDMRKDHQYKYLMYALRKRKRYIKTHKVKENEEIEILKFLFKLTDREAKFYNDIVYLEYGKFPNEYKETFERIKHKKGLIKK